MARARVAYHEGEVRRLCGVTYCLMPADVLIVTVPSPTTVEVVTTPDDAKVWDRVEAQTIAGLRERVRTLEALASSQAGTISLLRDDLEEAWAAR